MLVLILNPAHPPACGAHKPKLPPQSKCKCKYMQQMHKLQNPKVVSKSELHWACFVLPMRSGSSSPQPSLQSCQSTNNEACRSRLSILFQFHFPLSFLSSRWYYSLGQLSWLKRRRVQSETGPVWHLESPGQQFTAPALDGREMNCGAEN